MEAFSSLILTAPAICPSCGGRHMAQTVRSLDHIIFRVPVRQRALWLTIPLRYLFAAHPHLLSPVLGLTAPSQLF